MAPLPPSPCAPSAAPLSVCGLALMAPTLGQALARAVESTPRFIRVPSSGYVLFSYFVTDKIGYVLLVCDSLVAVGCQVWERLQDNTVSCLRKKQVRVTEMST
eukprot:3166171-Pyramimonas_sp.AAC.1